MKLFKKIGLIVFAFLISTLILILLGTAFYPANNQLKDLSAITILSTLPEDLEKYLAQNESRFQLKHDVEKKIIWSNSEKKQTEMSLVSIHGFSATRQEVSPVVEKLGEKLQANVFLTRLAGHGMDGESFGKAKAQDWILDANEALAIGSRLGKKVILVGTSTGAALAIHLAQNNPEQVQALVLLSANFRPASITSWLTSGPLGPALTNLLIGKNRSWQAANEKQAYFWTTSYPTIAIHEMMELLKYIDTIDLSQIKVPTLMLYTDRDDVVSLDLIKSQFSRFGSSQKKLIKIDSKNHIMAGDIMSPETTDPVISEIYGFVLQK